MHFELSPSIIWPALWIVNTYTVFQVNIFSNETDIKKMSKFLHHNDDNGDAKAEAIPEVFPGNSRAINGLVWETVK